MRLARADIRYLAKQIKYDLADLATAISMVESDGETLAVRYEPAFRWLVREKDLTPRDCSPETETTLQKMSWGLMQIMGATARSLGYKGWLTGLLDPRTNLTFGIKYLSRLQARYVDVREIISAYNAGHATDRNAAYVEKVMAELANLDKEA